MSALERFLSWLEEPQYKTVWSNDVPRNKFLRQMDKGVTALELVDLAESGESKVVERVFRNAQHGKAFTISYLVSHVEVIAHCVDGHDWGEWQYDFMGGDLRKCKRCEEVEQT